jgi:hypothetical protein
MQPAIAVRITTLRGGLVYTANIKWGADRLDRTNPQPALWVEGQSEFSSVFFALRISRQRRNARKSSEGVHNPIN